MGVTDMMFVVGLPITCIALCVAYWYRNRDSFQFGQGPKRQAHGLLPRTADYGGHVGGHVGGFDGGGAGCGGSARP
jgi:hypothetical protein